MGFCLPTPVQRTGQALHTEHIAAFMQRKLINIQAHGLQCPVTQRQRSTQAARRLQLARRRAGQPGLQPGVVKCGQHSLIEL